MGNVMQSNDFARLYSHFKSPITTLDCGGKCSPYNERGIPFCCDIRQVVPTAYQSEWEYLRSNTDLWHLWRGGSQKDTIRLRNLAPEDQVLIECQGHLHCQRDFRSIVCRAFPFFPYLDSRGEFIGLSYYWQYEDRCWVISNLNAVTSEYLHEFFGVFETIFSSYPNEKKNFCYQSKLMRKEFHRRKRSIIILHRNGYPYKITPHNERKRRIQPDLLPKFGVNKLSATLPFPDEL